MTAFQITEMKKFMASFLAGDCFDSFLLEEAFVEAAVTYHICLLYTSDAADE